MALAQSLRLPSPDTLDAFVARIVDVVPDGPGCQPACAALGDAWRARGVAPGDLVLLCLPNCADLLNQFFGVLMAGAVPALLSPTVPASRLRDIAVTMGARAVAARRLPLGDFGEESRQPADGLHIAMFAPAARAAAPGEMVLMSSGTSGFASGCVFDVDAVLRNALLHADAIGQTDDDVVLVCLPLYFSYALVAQALAALLRGSRLVVGGPPFTLPSYRRALHDQGVTISSLTPMLIRTMLSNDRSVLDLPRVLTIGGDALFPDELAQVVEARRGKDVYITYGLTQAGPRVATLAAHREPSSRYGSVGKPLPGTSVSLAPADVGGLSQLFVTSDTVMKRSIGRVDGGAHHKPSSRTIATGDAFAQDADGYLYFRGRLNDFISRRGEKINLAAVRRVASQLPHVVGARTLVVRADVGGNGAEDFDLELHVDTPGAGEAFDARGLLRRVLGQAEMPRQIVVQGTRAREELHFK